MNTINIINKRNAQASGTPISKILFPLVISSPENDQIINVLFSVC